MKFKKGLMILMMGVAFSIPVLGQEIVINGEPQSVDSILIDGLLL